MGRLKRIDRRIAELRNGVRDIEHELVDLIEQIEVRIDMLKKRPPKPYESPLRRAFTTD